MYALSEIGALHGRVWEGEVGTGNTVSWKGESGPKLKRDVWRSLQ